MHYRNRLKYLHYRCSFSVIRCAWKMFWFNLKHNASWIENHSNLIDSSSSINPFSRLYFSFFIYLHHRRRLLNSKSCAYLKEYIVILSFWLSIFQYEKSLCQSLTLTFIHCSFCLFACRVLICSFPLSFPLSIPLSISITFPYHVSFSPPTNQAADTFHPRNRKSPNLLHILPSTPTNHTPQSPPS